MAPVEVMARRRTVGCKEGGIVRMRLRREWVQRSGGLIIAPFNPMVGVPPDKVRVLLSLGVGRSGSGVVVLTDGEERVVDL